MDSLGRELLGQVSFSHQGTVTHAKVTLTAQQVATLTSFLGQLTKKRG
jgi:hypothetical protein